ncbi:MAG: hypothetical protein CM1200mP41_32750 [Gammaproteobacteria bacterium]|nr:MAG: hypothetical protein CM1200mP41_32750 [Gammaproteobacteria bacterium]
MFFFPDIRKLRADSDDRTPPDLRRKWYSPTAAEECSLEVDVDHRVPVGYRKRGDQTPLRHTGKGGLVRPVGYGAR